MVDYEFLAQRAKARRRALNLQQTTVAKALGVCSAWLSMREKRLPANHHGDRERCWEELLQVPQGWLRDASRPTPDHRLSSDWLDTVSLGKRAEARRCDLHLKKAHVARHIGVTSGCLTLWEAKLHLTHGGKKESRWEEVLQVPRGWLRDVRIPTPKSSETVSQFDLTPYALSTVVKEIRTVGVLLSQYSTVFRTTRFAELSDTEKKRATMFAHRYGISGPEGVMYQAIGNRYGLTRECVRQKIDRVLSYSRGQLFVLPQLMRLKKSAASVGNLSVAEFETAHRAILGPKLGLVDAGRFAREVLGFNIELKQARRKRC